MNRQLTESRADLLVRCEARIKALQSSMMHAADALFEIKQAGAYKEKGYDNFDSYCSGEWGMTKRYANMLIEASVAKVHLLPQLGADAKKITTERQLRELKDIPGSKLNAVIAEAKLDPKSNGQLSASVLNRAKKKVLKQSQAGTTTGTTTGGSAGATVPKNPQQGGTTSQPVDPAKDRAKRIGKETIARLRLQLSILLIRKQWEPTLLKIEQEIDNA